MFRRRPEAKSYPAIIVAIIGMGFLTNIVQNGFTLHIGDLLTLISAFFLCAADRLLRYADHQHQSLCAVVYAGNHTGTFGLIWSLLFEQTSYGVINWQAGLWPVIVLGILSSFGAQTLQIIGQRFTDPTPAGLILMTESMFGSIFSVVLGFEPFTMHLLLGGVLIVIAILIMQLDFSRFRSVE